MAANVLEQSSSCQILPTPPQQRTTFQCFALLAEGPILSLESHNSGLGRRNKAVKRVPIKDKDKTILSHLLTVSVMVDLLPVTGYVTQCFSGFWMQSLMEALMNLSKICKKLWLSIKFATIFTGLSYYILMEL